ncbi:hypothetical protein BD311DRAFT_763522 [Dichomitus squalens]|uniref:Uncharacterized protein n=1 Tax=Dichomitus squalens TaxID=114155 RepID=A0A4Q9MEX7_9APHY|nr:hypothetical protein BD311DRAFT_763522 [Dichomitus squalens]
MSEYMPLTEDDRAGTVPYDESPFASPKGLLSYLHLPKCIFHGALALLAINALIIGLAFVKASIIHEEIRRRMNVVDTRALPRPDAGNGLDNLYRS